MGEERDAEEPKGKKPGDWRALLKPVLERLRRPGEALGKALMKVGKRLAKHPLCNLGLHRWQMRGWGRCVRKRCDAYRSFGKKAGLK